jgi:hypothetical protein
MKAETGPTYMCCPCRPFSGVSIGSQFSVGTVPLIPFRMLRPCHTGGNFRSAHRRTIRITDSQHRRNTRRYGAGRGYQRGRQGTSEEVARNIHLGGADERTMHARIGDPRAEPWRAESVRRKQSCSDVIGTSERVPWKYSKLTVRPAGSRAAGATPGSLK